MSHGGIIAMLRANAIRRELQEAPQRVPACPGCTSTLTAPIKGGAEWHCYWCGRRHTPRKPTQAQPRGHVIYADDKYEVRRIA